MGEHKLKHIEILKTVPEIKESIEELKFGCIIYGYSNRDDKRKYHKMINDNNEKCIPEDSDGRELRGPGYESYYEVDEYGESDDGFIIEKIIGQIHEGHLRMFFEKYSIKKNSEFRVENFSIHDDGFIVDDYGKSILKLDNSKPYQEQLEEFFEKLNKWIIKEFKIDESLLNDNIS